jgi:hypothetical protein
MMGIRSSLMGIHCCTGAGQGVWQEGRGGRDGAQGGTVPVPVTTY